MRILTLTVVMAGVLWQAAETAGADEPPTKQRLAASLTFYASFDAGVNAEVARGDARMYTATDPSRKEVREGEHAAEVVITELGKWGKALQFGKKAEQTVLYQGRDNIAYAGPDQPFAGTVSLWMALHPDEDLEPGYVDPLQITDKAWNNSAFFLDFTKDDTPRHFRLGVFSDYAFWNPQDRGWDSIPVAERPMVAVERAPFARDRWTHVAFTFGDFNLEGENSTATLYLNGKSQGSLKRPQRFTWNPEQVAIMLGIYYTGRMDELAIFDRELSEAEVRWIFATEEPLRTAIGNN
jgi:hypothetical protein